MNVIRLMAIVSTTTVLAACGPQYTLRGTGFKGVTPFTVKLEVVDNGGGNYSLVNKNPRNRNCSSFPDTDEARKGCIVAASGAALEVGFKLSGSGGWYFNSLQICNVDDPASWVKPETFDDCELSDEQRADWVVLANNGVAVPGVDGHVDIAQFGKGQRKFELRDNNWREGYYFYRIEACVDKNDGTVDQCLWTDPGGQNKGYN